VVVVVVVEEIGNKSRKK